MQEVIKLIEEYIPFNEQETVDKQVMLQVLKSQPDCFERSNLVNHFTASSWIVNKERTKVLMCYHNLYKSYSWTGGHNDGDKDFLAVAIREAKEETGLKNIKVVTEKIFSIENIHVEGHEKRGKYVPCHLHLNVSYLLEADESEKLTIKEDENSALAWIAINELDKYVSEPWMMERIYNKLNLKLKMYK